MRPDIGRYLEGRMLEQIQLIKTIYDAATGAGSDVNVWIDGRELVFGKGEAAAGPGFMRVIPGEVMVTIAFPRGHEIPDPKKQFKGPRHSRTTRAVSHYSEVNVYVRRMIDASYAIES